MGPNSAKGLGSMSLEWAARLTIEDLLLVTMLESGSNKHALFLSLELLLNIQNNSPLPPSPCTPSLFAKKKKKMFSSAIASVFQ